MGSACRSILTPTPTAMWVPALRKSNEKESQRTKEGDTMHRRTCIHLTVLAAAMALVAGTIQPARAQDEKTPAFAQVLPADGKVLVTWAAVKDSTGYVVSRRNAGEDASKNVVVNA